MKLADIKSNLCAYDPRNPSYDEENGTAAEDCYCDNCFYGRHTMAEEILRLREKTNG